MKLKRVFTALGAIALSISLGLAAPATSAHAAQGGITNDLGLPGHAWFKVGHNELMQKGATGACRSTGLSKWNCTPLASAVNNEFFRNSSAAGYWSEFYYPGPGGTRSGTW